jgi:ABC-2 type transport system permease protein
MGLCPIKPRKAGAIWIISRVPATSRNIRPYTTWPNWSNTCAYVFSFAIYAVATGASTEVANAAVALVDEDRSPLSRQIQDALLQPYFQPPVRLTVAELDAAMDAGRYTFVMDIPPHFQADMTAGRQLAIQLNVDATAMSQAGMGARYLQHIIAQEILTFAQGREGDPQ